MDHADHTPDRIREDKSTAKDSKRSKADGRVPQSPSRKTVLRTLTRKYKRPFIFTLAFNSSQILI